MSEMYLNFLLAFIEGLGLIISPCILPILPLILAGSLEESKKKPYGIILGFILTFTLFTFFSKKIIDYFNFDPELIRLTAFVLLAIIAMIMMSTYLSEKFNYLTRKFANFGSQSSYHKKNNGFFSGIIFGSLVALIWTPCAGPILAAVIVQTVIQQTTLASFLNLLFFAIGAGVPMLLIVLFGRSLLGHFSFLYRYTNLLRKLLGFIILVSVIYMYFGNPYQTPQNLNPIASEATNNLINPLSSPYPAPAMDGITNWINSSPLKLSDLKGKVVLIDFWTYSCINCLRSLPYVKSWYDKYHDDGLVVIGIHTPEFAFEKKLSNVEEAVKKLKILYPVGLDNDYKTWQNFSNQYWPAHYLIDKNGNVVYQHFGEGEYDTMENNIRYLLKKDKANIPQTSNENLAELIALQTPETYLGYERAVNFASHENIMEDTKANYSYPEKLNLNNWALNKEWTINKENIASGKNSALKIHFHAKQVYLVMGSATPVNIKILLNGKPINIGAGADLKNSYLTVSNHRLYEILSLDKSQAGILELTFPEENVELYAFTFGNK